MFIQVALKHPGNVTKKMALRRFYLSREPHTFGELIEEAVRTSVAAYRARDERREPFVPLTDEEMTGMAEVGKFAWCLPVESRDADADLSLRVAREAIDDGLVRVFQNTRELTNFDEALTINEGDVFTFVRLTMLTGRMW